jgi:hypothetical protein
MKTIRTMMLGAFHMKADGDAAFTRVELFACLACVALMGAVMLPVLGATRSESSRSQCFNNLRQIGRAVRQWSGDHLDNAPWLTLVSDGGTKPEGGVKPGAAWTEYLALSNDLVSPRVLTCPADAFVKVASDWSSGPNGLANLALRGQSVSYLLGLHAYADRPKAIIAADFNIWMGGPEGCGPTAVNNALSIRTTAGGTPPPGAIQWTNGPHLLAGHVSFVDGSVMFLDSSGLTTTLSTLSSTENGNHHILRAH